MKNELVRIFMGDSSWLFLLELVFRTAVMYTYALALLRLLGKRGLVALTPFELVVTIGLGAAIGYPMLFGNVPLLHGMVIITVVVCLQRIFVYLTRRYRAVEVWAEGTPRSLVKDGVISLTALRREGLSRDDLYLSLREDGIVQLGQVMRAFLETTGRVSVWKYDPRRVRPGLMILPEDDEEAVKKGASRNRMAQARWNSCSRCGYTESKHGSHGLGSCPHCGAVAWVASSMVGVQDPESQAA